MNLDKLSANRRKRGEVNSTDLSNFAMLSEPELLSLLNSKIAVERTSAATHLRKYKNSNVVGKLCHQLTIEQKLYTKIAICDSLVECKNLSIKPLINLLGKIGNNQETAIPGTGFYKISYPLPRDIAARTLCRLGFNAIEPLENFITSTNNINALTQAIDAYGHIVFSNKIKLSSKPLQKLYKNHPKNNFLKFKIARCLSGIHDEWANLFLFEVLESNHEGLQLEALRSLMLLNVEVPGNIQNKFSIEMQKLESFIKAKCIQIPRNKP